MNLVTFSGTIETAAGSILTVSGSPVVTAAAPTVFGVTPDTSGMPTSLSADVALFRRNGFARMYGTTTCPQWTDKTVAPYVAGGTVLAFSAKTASIAEYKTNMDNIPANMTEVFYTWFHECNRPLAKGAPTLAQFQSMTAQLITLRNSHPNRAKIRIVPCFSWYPAALGGNQGTPWVKFMRDPAGNVFDFDGIAWDQYCVDSTSPNDPESFVTLPVSSGATYKLPVSIWETGIASGGGDPAAVAWLNAVAGKYTSAGVKYVAYWNSGSYKLNARPAPLAAWKALL